LYAALNAFGSQLAGINPGDPVSVSSPSVPGKTFQGHVVAILSPTAPTAAGFVVKILIPNPQRTLLPGMTVSATVRKRPVTGVSIPASAFVDDTHQTILTIDADKKAHLTKVTELARDANYAVVTGIASGALVVSNGTLAVADGQQVEVQGQ
jgi:multidrug efflux pump subunit AcrA (membrane-fusion protein)